MSTKSKNVVTKPQVCRICGKPTPKSGDIGHVCARLEARGFTPTRLAERRQELTVAELPKGMIKVADLHRKIDTVKHQFPGLSVNRMVTAIGRDRCPTGPVHPICTPSYDAHGVRWVNAWLATNAGLKAIASGDFSKAPKPTVQAVVPTKVQEVEQEAPTA